MRKLNWLIKGGLGLFAFSLLLSSRGIQRPATLFVEGFAIGLGLVLTIKGFFMERRVSGNR
jgi:hypothetical protein